MKVSRRIRIDRCLSGTRWQIGCVRWIPPTGASSSEVRGGSGCAREPAPAGPAVTDAIRRITAPLNLYVQSESGDKSNAGCTTSD